MLVFFWTCRLKVASQSLQIRQQFIVRLQEVFNSSFEICVTCLALVVQVLNTLRKGLG